MRLIELLSPARNLDCGIAAVNHGADAVYIGAQAFGARAAAGNSVADIEMLCRYAHQFRTKVFVALNTILTDGQLPVAEKLAWEVYNAGADALILQDLGLLKMNLPPIALHASTQTDNRSVEKVHFLQNAGFSRIVLARELSLNQIAEIAAKTDVELEVFIHGALCVSYSGQCYISEACVGRSANRGECAQFCRLPYNLTDKNGKILAKNKYLLSLKDLDLSSSLSELLAVGTTSLKIEGRLKDANYVKNITAFYRKKLDAIFEEKTKFCKSSSGKTIFFFEPNPEKTFCRSTTNYFLNSRQNAVIQPETPKSTGEEIGKITFVGKKFLEISTDKNLHNGDGLCFFYKNEELAGFRVNQVKNGQIFPNQMPDIQTGTTVFRNQDMAFEKLLSGKTAERKIDLKISFFENENGLKINVLDEDGVKSVLQKNCEKHFAEKPEQANDNIKKAFEKLGNTIFELKNFEINAEKPLFFSASVLNDFRREMIENHLFTREKLYTREQPKARKTAHFPEKNLTYLGNVANQKARAFYAENGVVEIAPAFELQPQENVPLMFCKHCIKHFLGFCTKEKTTAKAFSEPLFLEHKNHRFTLEFDCKKCEMRIIKS